jgi:DNA-binding NarL/FixJ family response regulator
MIPLPAAAAPIRIMLVDDHALFRTALRHVLETCADMQIVAEASNGQEAIRLAAETAPDIVCMDHRLPILGGVETTRQLRISHPAIKVIGLSACAGHATVAAILAAGAVAYVDKEHAGEQLIAAIRSWHPARAAVQPLG